MTSWGPPTGRPDDPVPRPDRRALLHPVGPLPPLVYWRRRVMLLAAVVVIVGIVLALVVGGGSSARSPSASTRGSSTPAGAPPSPRPARTPTPTPRPAASAVSACATGTLAVSAATDASSYPPGVEPHLQVHLLDSGPACSLTPAQAPVLVISSGPDRIWSNVDCTPAARLRLAHGAQTLVTVWNLLRSEPHCAPPGNGVTSTQPGVYHLTATVAGQSASVRFSLQ